MPTITEIIRNMSIVQNYASLCIPLCTHNVQLLWHGHITFCQQDNGMAYTFTIIQQCYYHDHDHDHHDKEKLLIYFRTGLTCCYTHAGASLMEADKNNNCMLPANNIVRLTSPLGYSCISALLIPYQNFIDTLPFLAHSYINKSQSNI